MGDFTKAGLDKGDLEKELEHVLTSAKFIYKSYLVSIEDLTQEELEYDLFEYRDYIDRVVMPLVKRAEETRKKKLINMAYEIRHTYEKLIEAIEEKLKTF
ncbi:MAG: hypothetical protein ACK4MW_02925 [Aquificaceae bacterium]